MTGSGTSEDPWQLQTAPGSSAYTMYRDDDAGLLVCQVGRALGLVELEHNPRNNRVRAL